MMERRLLRAIINPAMIGTWVLGLWLAWLGPDSHYGWFVRWDFAKIGKERPSGKGRDEVCTNNADQSKRFQHHEKNDQDHLRCGSPPSLMPKD